MSRIVIELTNRCNLRCQHCFSGRHGGKDDLPLAVLQRVLAEARACGFDHLTFTGGDPTIHPQFEEVIRRTVEAGYWFSFVTNGFNFVQTYPKLLPYQHRLKQITFSLDGAIEATHDALRGKGSYRRVLQAMSVCNALHIPFSNNLVVTRHNRHELAQAARLAAQLGSKGLRFGHLMHSPLTTAQGSDLSPAERKVADAEIRELKRSAELPIGLAPGLHTTDLFPCTPLQLQEVNISCQGFLTKCCHLSGHGGVVGQGDVVGDLQTMTFAEGMAVLTEANRVFKEEKLKRLKRGEFRDADYSPCWYCSNYFEKLNWLKTFEANPWVPDLWDAAEKGFAGSLEKTR